MNRVYWPLLLSAAVIAVVYRLSLFYGLHTDGLAIDDLGLALQFWRPGELAARLPVWWSTVRSGVAGNWPPGYSVVVSLAAHLTGDPLVMARWINALAAGVLVLVVARTANLLAKDRAGALVAAWFAALAPLAISWDVRGRPETLFQIFFLGAQAMAIAYLARRRVADLIALTFMAGVACCFKYDALLLAPGLMVCWFLHLRAGNLKHLAAGLPAMVGFAAALAWMLAQPGHRAGYYGELTFTGAVWQAVQWIPLTIAAWPAVATWPIAGLAVWGLVALFRQRESRAAAWWLTALMAFSVMAIGINRDWTSRHLLIVLPLTSVLAGVGWSRAPRFGRVGAVFAVVVALYAGAQAYSWVSAERSQWQESITIGRAAGRLCAQSPRPVIWTDDIYLAPYWAGCDLQPLHNLDQVRPGDYVLLHELFGALRRKMLVADSLRRLGPHTKIAQAANTFRPLSGGLFDPAELARRRSLAEVGPRVFWNRKNLVEVSTVIVRRDQTP